MNNELKELFGDVIYSYSRKQAIADGMLADVTEQAKEAGFKISTVLTSALWETVKNIPKYASCEDFSGRLWDVLWMCSVAARRNREESIFFFPVIMSVKGGKRTLKLRCEIHGGDNGEPCITIGFPEDF